jgi:hypothetical protein
MNESEESLLFLQEGSNFGQQYVMNEDLSIDLKSESHSLSKEDKKRRRTQQSNPKHTIHKKISLADNNTRMCIIHESSDSDNDDSKVSPPLKWGSKIWSCEMV